MLGLTQDFEMMFCIEILMILSYKFDVFDLNRFTVVSV